ncbi:hypothetical protein BU23DRAFT_513104 [Bimuria novae-zelandiae CBS 107.79]|uniref:AAA+ ATPase domain-containing protein n=1 Tax=Bimuria novae-zelandiae CBS 107.79 TaxID=1447943 RepID=A0A6A5V818_9PLEO|nr:hypothetical protein BU23DRAFT_513104 [Bimuria novae-zelandiae CBS 107.79]
MTTDQPQGGQSSAESAKEEAYKRSIQLLEARTASLEAALAQFLPQGSSQIPQSLPTAGTQAPLLNSAFQLPLSLPYHPFLYPSYPQYLWPLQQPQLAQSQTQAQAQAPAPAPLVRKSSAQFSTTGETSQSSGAPPEVILVKDAKDAKDVKDAAAGDPAAPYDSNDSEKSKEGDNEGAAEGQDQAKDQEDTRIWTVINKWNNTKSIWEDVEDKFETPKDGQNKAATYRRNIDPHNEKKVDFEDLEIHSQELKDLLSETDNWWGDYRDDKSREMKVETPFYPFVWSWDKYQKACDQKEDDSDARKQARKALEKLMQLISRSAALESYFRSRDELKSSKKVKFRDLWTLFRHGGQVYARSYRNELQMFEVRYIKAPPYDSQFFVSCIAFDWDGLKFWPYTYDFYIKEFSGEKPINSLEIFPVEYYQDVDGNAGDVQLRERLIERGKKYVDFVTKEPISYQCRYEGTATITPSGPQRAIIKRRAPDAKLTNPSERYNMLDDELDLTTIEITGKQNRVIIDNYTFIKSERNPMKGDDVPPLGKKVPYIDPDCVCSVCKTSPFQWKPESKLEEGSFGPLGEAFGEDEKRLQFLPPRLLGFALKEKVWGQFLVDNLTKVGFVDDTEHKDPFWEELQLRQEAKDQLMALVKFHKAPAMRKPNENTGGGSSKVFDVIEGKGQGVVILLHGPPGVGKTLTAETIAIATGRPLLTVSVAEIGIQAHEAERKLTDVFEDAARWDAVLLMDEADVFVEERKQGDLSRNSLVSVLLRCLEYYDGLIILTTNRVRSIDPAMQSRIHLAIRYQDLTAEQRIAIYKNRLKYIPDEEFEDRKALEKSLEKGSLTRRSNKANGRQIRNIIIKARMLARYRNEKLTIDHLISADEDTSDFINSMSDVLHKFRGKNELDYEV